MDLRLREWMGTSGQYAEAVVDADKAVEAMPDLPQLAAKACERSEANGGNGIGTNSGTVAL